MAGALTWCGIKIFGIRLDVGRRYLHIIMCGLQSYLNYGGTTIVPQRCAPILRPQDFPDHSDP